jgi:DNA polymerase I
MYRNVTYSNTKGHVKEWTWDDDGNPSEKITPFKPYLYIETNESKFDAVSIFNTKLKRLEFRNDKSRRAFVDSTHKRLFYHLPVKQQYLLERYQNTPMEEMIKNPLRTFYLDIEVYSHDTFPEAEVADFPVNLITIFDTLTEKFYTWGLANDYNYEGLEDIGVDPNDIVYVSCSSESDLLDSFIRFWSKNYPDLITTWNGSTFDIPYIVNRTRRLLGEEVLRKLSPNNFIYSRSRSNIFGRYYTHWVIDAVSDVDYLELYAKSEMNQHESYKLDYIGNYEGVDGKVAYESANLATLADEDWSTFVTYNIQDVNILVKLEKKKNYLKIARGKSYRGFSTLDKSLDSVPIVTGMIAKAGLDMNQMIVTFKPQHEDHDYVGGYVFKPSGKVHRGIVSFDVNSLYPNTMITLNTSPETKIGKVIPNGESFIIELVNGKSKTVTEDVLNKFLLDNNIIRTKSNILFSQKKMGICPMFLDNMYKERKAVQAKMALETDPDIKSRLNIEQYLLKILLNSVYGVFGNKYFGLYDIDIASSVTMTGQAMIKESTEIVQKYAKEKYGVDENIIVYGDTDSNFFDFGKIMEKANVKFFEDSGDTQKVTEESAVIIQEFEDNLNFEINEWAKKELNANNPKYKFSREKICSVGMFITKKNYILRVLDNEGTPCDKIVEKGVELVKSSHSDAIKKIIRDVVYCIFYDKGKTVANSNYIDGLDEFRKLPPQDIAWRKNAKDHEKWSNMARGFECGKGTPIHHKGAIYYNNLLKEMKLEGEYPKIITGQKVKTLYLQKNKYGLSVISFLDKLPEEFGLVPDYEFQYKKMVTPLIQRCYDGSDWAMPNIDKISTTDLFDFFGLD